MGTFILTILLLAGVLCLFGCSALISHYFGLDNIYNESLKDHGLRNISGINEIDAEEFFVSKKDMTIDITEQRRQDSRF